jgi:RNA polymerase sigma factor (sigma-70 family)
VRNLARDYHREQRLREDASIEEILDDPIPEAEVRRDIETALSKLSSRDRELIHRRYYRDESYLDIAVALGMTVNNVGVSLLRALNRLRILLGGL